MLGAARGAAAGEGLANVDFLQADAQIHAFAPGSFDAVLSRTGAMFFGDPVAAFRNIGLAHRPGGRLALLVWQPPQRNEWFTELTTTLAAGRTLPVPPPQAPGPFSLADPARIRSVLTAAGYAEPEVVDLEEPIWFGPDAEGAHSFVAGLLGWMLQGLDDEGRASALAALRRLMDAHQTPHGVLFGSACWLVTARRGG
jgi:SAM-dependent methyltransferase